MIWSAVWTACVTHLIPVQARQGSGSRWRSAAQSLMAMAGGLISVPAMKDGVKRSISVVGSALLSEWVTGTALWGALTAAFISGGQLGGTFSMGLQRLQGTVAGVHPTHGMVCSCTLGVV